MPVWQPQQAKDFSIKGSDLEGRGGPIPVFKGSLDMSAEFALQLVPEQGFNLGPSEGATSFDHLVYARLHNRKSSREKSRALARHAWIGRLQRQRYRLGDNISEMDAAAKDIPAVATVDMGDAAHGF
nr:hypothetical protein [Sphingomonas arenae]